MQTECNPATAKHKHGFGTHWHCWHSAPFYADKALTVCQHPASVGFPTSRLYMRRQTAFCCWHGRPELSNSVPEACLCTSYTDSIGRLPIARTMPRSSGRSSATARFFVQAVANSA